MGTNLLNFPPTTSLGRLSSSHLGPDNKPRPQIPWNSHSMVPSYKFSQLHLLRSWLVFATTVAYILRGLARLYEEDHATSSVYPTIRSSQFADLLSMVARLYNSSTEFAAELSMARSQWPDTSLYWLRLSASFGKAVGVSLSLIAKCLLQRNILCIVSSLIWWVK